MHPALGGDVRGHVHSRRHVVFLVERGHLLPDGRDCGIHAPGDVRTASRNHADPPARLGSGSGGRAGRCGGLVAQWLSLLAWVPALGVTAGLLLLLVLVVAALLLVARYFMETRGRDLRDFEAAAAPP
jgi:hypothetical protein